MLLAVCLVSFVIILIMAWVIMRLSWQCDELELELQTFKEYEAKHADLTVALMQRYNSGAINK